jgi:hypothetical protein
MDRQTDSTDRQDYEKEKKPGGVDVVRSVCVCVCVCVCERERDNNTPLRRRQPLDVVVLWLRYAILNDAF